MEQRCSVIDFSINTISRQYAEKSAMHSPRILRLSEPERKTEIEKLAAQQRSFFNRVMNARNQFDLVFGRLWSAAGRSKYVVTLPEFGEVVSIACIGASRNIRADWNLNDWQPKNKEERSVFIALILNHLTLPFHGGKRKVIDGYALNYLKKRDRISGRETLISFNSIEHSEYGENDYYSSLLNSRLAVESHEKTIVSESELNSKVIAFCQELKPDVLRYFKLRLQDYTANQIEEELGLTKRQRDYLQQKFQYALTKFKQENGSFFEAK